MVFGGPPTLQDTKSAVLDSKAEAAITLSSGENDSDNYERKVIRKKRYREHTASHAFFSVKKKKKYRSPQLTPTTTVRDKSSSGIEQQLDTLITTMCKQFCSIDIIISDLYNPRKDLKEAMLAL
ncbi:hypothetical protein ABEB36_012877 [Hypothenemus hampei]|uniref:Uncharacterized protein n=1 Tax=Hypothenemus hampei TaxID=57062 RepID=A0ABD1E625_HYPHA